MTIISNGPLGYAGHALAVQQMEKDQQAITLYSKQMQGAGLESFEAPSHDLVIRGLNARYGEYMTLSSGQEGIGTLILLGAAIGGGVAVYKKLMLAKNSPITKELSDVLNKVTATYDAKWIEGKKSVDKEVTCGKLNSLFSGNNLAALGASSSKYAAQGERESKASGDYLITAWSKIRPLLDRWKKAGEGEEDEVIELMTDLYPEPPYTTMPAINTKVPGGKGGKVSALAVTDYPKAVALLKELLKAAEEIDGLSYDIANKVGFKDGWYEGVSAEKRGEEHAFQYGHYRYYLDHYGVATWKLHDTLISASRGLEEWIVKSFK
jgi:hypothetical protein